MDHSSFCDDVPAKRYKGLRDYHLRSALSSYNLVKNNIPDWERSLKNEVAQFEDNFAIILRDPSMILGRILQYSPILSTYGQEFFTAGRCLAIESLLYSSLPAPLFRHASQLLMENRLQTKYMIPSLFLQNAVICSNAMNAKKQLPSNIMQNQTDIIMGIVTSKLSNLQMTIKVGSECFGVILEDGKMSIHDLDHLRNWSDKCTERFNIEMACIFGFPLNRVIYPPVELLYEFWGIWDPYLSDLGNPVYKVVKIFEAMAVGVLLEKNKNSVITPLSDFRETTLRDFKNNLPSHLQSLNQAALEMDLFLMRQDSMQYISQLYGLYRTWGHPIVDPKSGIAKVMKLGTKRKEISEVLPIQIRRIFMTKFSVWYKGAKGAYPDIDSNMHLISGNQVREIILNNGSTQELKSFINSPDWDDIRFAKNIEIPQTFNLSEMVADKAVSPDRSILVQLSKRKGGTYDANHRRGVLQWLLRTPEACGDFLQRINDQMLTDDECVIGLYQKEREINETPRMFALMSHSIRNYIVTTESMLSEDILPAFPSITMTNSLLSLQKKIYSVSYKQSRNSKDMGFSPYKDVTIIVNIDFEKWNLNFRRETTHPLFQAIGDLYGLDQLYNRTYDIFENSYIYLADGSYRPEVSADGFGLSLNPPQSYMGHIGGFEGLRQKGWTIFTDCGLELICDRHNCTYSVMGQGDNQVLSLTWKTYLLDGNREITEEGRSTITSQFHTFMQDLVQTFGELGLPVKALETWTSENLFLYGKVPTLRGVPLAMSLKKICRAYYLANEEIMTLDCSLATIQSNAMAACMSDVTSNVPYVIYKIQTMLALKAYYDYHVLLGEGAFTGESGDKWRFTTSTGVKWEFTLDGDMKKWNMLMMISWFPKIIGGLSIATWFDFLMRGFPDKVSSSLTWIKLLLSVVTDEDMRSALKRIYQCHINPEKSFVLLVEDPCALNLVVPVDARAAMKQAVQELFEGLQGVNNQEFASLFQFNKEWQKNEFCNALCKGDILHPRLLHDLAAASTGGYIDSVISKVTKASTINKAALKSSNRNPGDKIERHERNMMRYLQWKLSPSNVYQSKIDHRCPTMQSRMLRLRSWDKILEGVTVPFPLAFLELRDCTQTPEHYDSCDRNFISITLPESFCKGHLEEIHQLGASPPYLGSETKEKIGSDPSRQVFGKEPLLSRPLRLLRIINWFVPKESHAGNLICHLLQSVSDLDPSDYISREMGVTGSEAHRYRDQALKHGVMSANLYTLGSHMHISTDPWIKYTRGMQNYTINYQAILCSLQALIGEYVFWCYRESISPSREYHFHESCEDCIEPLTEEFHDLADDSALCMIPQGRSNPYLWVEEASLTLKYKNDPQLSMQIPECTYAEYIQLQNKRAILTSWISEDIVKDISGLSYSGEMRMLESRDYPRVMYKKLGVSELWNELARTLIASAGIRYSAGDGKRVTYISGGRELAADDIMKSPPGTYMGAAMFYTWPEKFAEIHHYDGSSIFPDSNPPTLLSCCISAQANLRDVIRRVVMNAPDVLYIPRISRTPLETMKRYWYRILVSEGSGCPQCLKLVCNITEISSLNLYRTKRCELGHLTISKRMARIKFLTASEDRLVKDSISYRFSDEFVKTPDYNIKENPASVILFDSSSRYRSEVSVTNYIPVMIKNNTWKYSGSLPTVTKCRVLETLSILKSNFGKVEISNGCIFGDGLGQSSCILSNVFPYTYWISASLQDSERSSPQSYPHVLIPQNPDPSPNVNYSISKFRYNDILDKKFVSEWQCWVRGGLCWCEAEIKEGQLDLVINLCSLCDWEYMIFRLELPPYLYCEVLEYLNQRSQKMICASSGSFDILSYECVIICQGLSLNCNRKKQPISPRWALEEWEMQIRSLYEKAGSLKYAEYLVSLESPSEISTMLRRLDHWYSLVGMTHILSCSKLFTPLWWDLQTGKVPEWIQNLGENRTYFMYRSDLIALQARLIALALSLLKNMTELTTEVDKKNHWLMLLKHQKKHLIIEMVRGEYQSYGPDEELIEKYIPILRKLNNKHKRWWSKMPKRITFSYELKKNTLWISKMAMLTPATLPDVE
ncbi:TPA_asm: L [Fraxinus gammacytorhabdovirus 2]|nr:TPA_asm: L [Fraxinus gammacytorhabdovirus 2]